jgi:hypothetical protein
MKRFEIQFSKVNELFQLSFKNCFITICEYFGSICFFLSNQNQAHNRPNDDSISLSQFSQKTFHSRFGNDSQSLTIFHNNPNVQRVLGAVLVLLLIGINPASMSIYYKQLMITKEFNGTTSVMVHE